MNVLKKIFSVSVTFTTILWSVGVSAFVPAVAVAASCPTLNPGDMIKVTGKAAIFVVNNAGKVLYFPSGDEFKSFRPTYGGYISITQDCYDSLSVPSTYPGGVNFAPGSYVVKRASSDQLYVVEPGNTLAKISAADAKTLYGAGYKVMTIGDQFWPNYVNRGADVMNGMVHPGMLVKNGGKTWYVDASSKLWEVTDAGFTANGFQTKFVHSVPDASVAGLAVGGQLTAELKSITDKTQSGGVAAPVNGGTTVVSGSLNVSLASDNPFSSTIVSDVTGGSSSASYGAQANIKVLKLAFAAGNDGDAVVTKVTLTRGGISADTDISNMYLYDGETMVGGNPSILSTKVTFSNTNGLFTVARGSTKNIEVRLDLRNNVSAGKTFSFSVASASDVMTSGSSSVGGSYPLTGNTFTSAAVTDLGKLLFENSTPSAAGTVDPGTTGFTVWKVKMTDSNQDVELRRIKFTIVGSVNVGDLKNFTLSDGAKTLGTLADMASDKTLTFDLTASPYVVTKGQIKYLSLMADVVAGTNRTFYASIQNQADVTVYDKNYNVFVKPNGTDSFTIVQAGGASSVNWTVNVGTLVQTLATDSPNGNVAKSGTSITLGKFNWKANGEDIKVSALSVSSTASTISDTLANVRLMVNGSQVGTTISSLTANGAANSGWGSFGNSFIVKAGTTAVVTVVADLTGTVTANDTIRVGLSAGSSNYQGIVSLTSGSSVAQNGNTVTVKTGQVSVAKNSSFGERTSNSPAGTVNGVQKKVGSFVITAGAGEDVTVSQITLSDVSTSFCIGSYMKNLTLMGQDGKQFGQTYPNPSASCSSGATYTFNASPSVTVANGAQYIVDVYADLVAQYTTGAALIKVTAVAAQGKNTGNTADAGSSVPLNLQAEYISGSGALMAQVDSDTSVALNYLMGATDQDIAKFKITASSTEPVNITQLVVSARLSNVATGTIRNIRLIDQDTGMPIGAAVSSLSDTVAGSDSSTTTFSHATFTNLTFKVPAGTSKSLVMRVDFSTYNDGGFSFTGQQVAPVLLVTSGTTNGFTNPVTATGDSSGSSLTATISQSGSVQAVGTQPGAYAASSTLYRAKLTTAWASDAPSGASSPSAAQTVAKFVVTNLANAGNYTATVNYINFNFSTTVSQTGGVNTARALTVYKDSLATTAVATTNFASTQTFGSANSGNTAFTSWTSTVDITAGSSKTFYVTLDTTDAASQKSLSVRIPSAGVVWTDGANSITGAANSLSVMGQDLPLVYKTFTY